MANALFGVLPAPPAFTHLFAVNKQTDRGGASYEENETDFFTLSEILVGEGDS